MRFYRVLKWAIISSRDEQQRGSPGYKSVNDCPTFSCKKWRSGSLQGKTFWLSEDWGRKNQWELSLWKHKHNCLNVFARWSLANVFFRVCGWMVIFTVYFNYCLSLSFIFCIFFKSGFTQNCRTLDLRHGMDFLLSSFGEWQILFVIFQQTLHQSSSHPYQLRQKTKMTVWNTLHFFFNLKSPILLFLWEFHQSILDLIHFSRSASPRSTTGSYST